MSSGGQLQHLIGQTQNITALQNDLKPILLKMQQWQDNFAADLKAATIETQSLQPQSDLAQQIKGLNTKIDEQIQGWEPKWAELSSAQSLAETFTDKVMLLVFGKFNAGKSSLCNLLAECFRMQGQTVQYFYVQDEQIHYTGQLLREGATETTAQLQGVCLGERLVLLDTPGLHSATVENAALTQRFIDSADGVLWLSSSTSPGQVQELDVLARELKRHKPLFPIVTRSDQVEEDEVNGEICTVLCNKPLTQRTLQEADVYSRTKDKLREMAVDTDLLKPPVSVSTQMARQAGLDSQAMAEAGFDRLFSALLEIIQPALHYKQRKPAEMFLHYLQEQVLESLFHVLQPSLEQLHLTLKHHQSALVQQQQNIAENVWRSIVPELPQLLEQYVPTQAVDTVYQIVSQWLEQEFSRQIGQQLADYRLESVHSISLKPDHQVGYETISGEVGHERLYGELCRQINTMIKSQTADIISQCDKYLKHIENGVGQLQQLIPEYSRNLTEIAQQLRQNPA